MTGHQRTTCCRLLLVSVLIASLPTESCAFVFSANRVTPRKHTLVLHSSLFSTAKNNQPTTRSTASWRLVEKDPKQFALPYQTKLVCTSNASLPAKRVMIRPCTLDDISQVVDMCVQEYGSMDRSNIPSATLDPHYILDWLDRLSLSLLVEYTCVLKLWFCRQDHQILVVDIVEDDEAKQRPFLAGMIEVSLQPPIPERNPPPFPIPFKKLLFGWNGRPLQGWITNLLIVPEYRRLGLSQLLVGATEHYATSTWRSCTSMHLHCDAHPTNGRIAQRLYKKLQYDTKCQVMIQQVPLYYLSKKLS